MKTRPLSPMDASWLYVESHETPMHVASLMYYSLPDNAPADYLQQVIADLKKTTEFYPPWNLKLRTPRLKTLAHAWVEDNDLDIDYHLRHSALPKPGGERELGVLVSRLHSHPLDFRRPPWECHIIEGLEGNRFAMYIKMHHSLIDGVSGVRMLQRTLSATADEQTPAFWSVKPGKPSASSPVASTASAVNGAMGALKGQINSVPKLFKAIGEVVKAGRDRNDPMTVPFEAPKSVLNGRITGQRRFATQQYSVQQLKDLAKAADCTLNDIVLWLCGTSLRRFLKENNTLPARTLTAGIPVSVRPADDQGTGNAISFIMSTLGTDVADPLKRLEAIKAATQRAKEHLQSLPASAITNYTMLIMAPYILSLVTGLAGRTRPVFNVTISNVPGPREYMYFRGCRMEATYPVSLATHGQALNITCQSYADTLNFGFTGCRDTLPSMQRMAVYMGEALQELEKLLLKNRRRKVASTRRAKAATA